MNASHAATGSQHAASAISGHYDTRTAAMEVAEQIAESLAGPCDLALFFASFHHARAMKETTEIIRRTLAPSVLIGTTAESALADDEEREGRAGLSMLGLSLGEASVQPWRWPREPDDPPDDIDAMRVRTGLRDDTRAVLLIGDPFTTPMPQLLDGLNACCAERSVPVIGGMASGASLPGHNVLAIDDELHHEGVIGVTISGPVQVDATVSQGCRPIGNPLVITRAEGNVVHELGGEPAMQALRDIAESLSDEQRQLLSHGLLAGMVIDESRPRYGRGDFVMRNVMGFDQKTGAMAIGAPVKNGRTIQFHARDAETAHEDLQLLLDAQQLHDPPFAALLFTCNGRGTKLFDEPNHDVSVMRQRLGEPPLAGFFAAGEIGPIGGQAFLHGHTACAALFRRTSD